MTSATPSSEDRLDRIEAAISAMIQHGQQVDERLDRLTATVDRNAAAIMDERIQRREEFNELRNAIATTNQSVDRMAQRMDGFSEDVRSLTAAVDQLQATVMTHLREHHNNGNE